MDEMIVGKIVALNGGGEKDVIADAVRQIKRNAALMIEYAEVTANIRYAKYLGLVKAGFTEAQALQLCAASPF